MEIQNSYLVLKYSQNPKTNKHDFSFWLRSLHGSTPIQEVKVYVEQDKINENSSPTFSTFRREMFFRKNVLIQPGMKERDALLLAYEEAFSMKKDLMKYLKIDNSRFVNETGLKIRQRKKNIEEVLENK